MIYILRHGLDDERFLGGWSSVDLIDTGKEQINLIGKYIKEQQFDIRMIYSSDIKRAISSTKIINNYLNLNVQYTPLLRELNKGDFAGLNKKELKLPYSDALDYKYPNGESMLEFYSRIKSNLNEILSYDNSLLITHRGVINMMYFILNNIELNPNKELFGVTHASLHEYNPLTRKIKKIKD